MRDLLDPAGDPLRLRAGTLERGLWSAHAALGGEPSC
jgi:hypothetical protein